MDSNDKPVQGNSAQVTNRGKVDVQTTSSLPLRGRSAIQANTDMLPIAPQTSREQRAIPIYYGQTWGLEMDVCPSQPILTHPRACIASSVDSFGDGF